MAKRSFTANQKAAILQEADQQGVIATCRKHQISSSLFYQWRDKFSLKGKNGLEHGQCVFRLKWFFVTFDTVGELLIGSTKCHWLRHAKRLLCD